MFGFFFRVCKINVVKCEKVQFMLKKMYFTQ